jgi:hypothetical protein
MTYTAIPVEFEIYDEDAKKLMAKVTMFDEGGATIEMKSVFDRTTFDAIVPSLQYALSAMKLDGDK